jgi:hypothetical protein
MTAIEKYLFTPLYYPESTGAVLRWWESRRLFFNVCVGAAGLLSLATISLMTHLLPLGGPFPVTWRAVLVYAVMANLAYLLGPAADLALRQVLGDRAPALGPVLFRYGLAFSIGLSLLPIPLAALGWLISLIG